MPKVLEIAVPDASALLRSLKVVHFCDAYQATLRNPKLSAQDAYVAVFGHAPRWAKSLMKLRGVVARALGLKHVTGSNFPLVQSTSYQVGQRVGLFSVRSVEPGELIVGDDDKHLDFRISIYRSSANGIEVVTVSTAVEIHNKIGRLYMLVVKPFHRLMARSMVQRAVDAGRL